MEECEALRTMECLRRRLLAERQASLTAKQEAELMGKRSEELENQIRSQIQMTEKAEKKLALLTKKLATLNFSSTLMNSQLSASSEMCDEDKEDNTQITGSVPADSEPEGGSRESQVAPLSLQLPTIH